MLQNNVYVEGIMNVGTNKTAYAYTITLTPSHENRINIKNLINGYLCENFYNSPIKHYFTKKCYRSHYSDTIGYTITHTGSKCKNK